MCGNFAGCDNNKAAEGAGRGGRWNCVTCGAERDERQGVLADHRQLIFGQWQSVYDVLDEVIGDDRRHVPPQFPQYHQFPVLQKTMIKEKKKRHCYCTGPHVVLQGRIAT